ERALCDGNNIQGVRARCCQNVGRHAKIFRVQSTESFDLGSRLRERSIPPPELYSLVAPIGIEYPEVLCGQSEGRNDQFPEKSIARELVITIFGGIPIADSVNKNKWHGRLHFCAGIPLVKLARRRLQIYTCTGQRTPCAME